MPKSFLSVNSISNNYLFSLHYLDYVISTNLNVLVVCRDRNKLSSTRTVTYFLYQASDQLKFYRKNYLLLSPNCSADVSFPSLTLWVAVGPSHSYWGISTASCHTLCFNVGKYKSFVGYQVLFETFILKQILKMYKWQTNKWRTWVKNNKCCFKMRLQPYCIL